MHLDAISPTSETSLLSSDGKVNGLAIPPKKCEEVKLKKELRLIDGVAIIVGIIVGSGIFITPKGVLQETKSPGLALLVWTLSGLLSMVGALCYAELGTAIPHSGGDYAYIYEAFGPLPAFLYLWCTVIIVIPSTNAIMSLTFANYVIQPFFGGCPPPDNAVRLVAASAVLLLTFLNCYKVKWTTHLQDFLMFFKMAALAVIVVVGFVWVGSGRYQNLDNAFEGSATEPGSIALAFYSGIFSFAGWNYLNFVTEELQEPYKNLPRAIGISLPTVTLIYVLVNVSYFIVMLPEDMLSSNAVGVTFGEQALGVMKWIMPVFIAGSVFGGLSCHIFTSARIMFVGARRGHFPSSMALISMNNLTPAPALIFSSCLSIMMLGITDIIVLINYTSFVESLFVLWSICGLLWLRWKRPLLHRPIKVNLIFPIIFFIVSTFLVCLPLYDQPDVGVGLLGIVTGIPVYFIAVFWKAKPVKFQQFVTKVTVGVQKLFMAVHDGEKHYDS